jgi:hypothetical protein
MLAEILLRVSFGLRQYLGYMSAWYKPGHLLSHTFLLTRTFIVMYFNLSNLHNTCHFKYYDEAINTETITFTTIYVLKHAGGAGGSDKKLGLDVAICSSHDRCRRGHAHVRFGPSFRPCY